VLFLQTNAKLGDQLGVDFWSAKSKYGATIQTVLDYTMSLNPKKEDVTEILPHVASIAAAYGDPTGKYAAFLKKMMLGYQSKPFWFYDQTSALPSSPAAHSSGKRSSMWAREGEGEGEGEGKIFSFPGAQIVRPDSDASIPFACPIAFGGDGSGEVELDDGVFVTCSQLKPFYLAITLARV